VGIDISATQLAAARQAVPEGEFIVQAGEALQLAEQFDYVIISDTLNLAADVQQLLERIHSVAHADTRLILNFPSAAWRPLWACAEWLGLRRPQPRNSWLDARDVANLLRLANWEPITHQPRLLMPLPLLGLDRLLNRWFGPPLAWLCLTVFSLARPVPARNRAAPTVSVIIPARNEAGNIEAAVLRTPAMGGGTELIFVEGNSRDHTWAEIQRVAQAYPERRIKIMQQPGRGKGDAVRVGFAAATGDILMILDADLTMPPEELPKFYQAIAERRAEFANGCRLVYPMEEGAMQFLNLCANKAFGLIFTFLSSGLRKNRRQPGLLRRFRSFWRFRPAFRRRQTQSEDRRRADPLPRANLRHHQHPTLEARLAAAAHGAVRRPQTEICLICPACCPSVRNSASPACSIASFGSPAVWWAVTCTPAAGGAA
jgi:hypothetical protein